MATSRLKRKVEQRAEDGSAQGGFGNLLESFVSLGTPLPSLASKADVGEFKPIWEQEVVDEKGRRRLHGAFTGGFSAGYFNTVGSKEGWTPTTFKSSRAVRGAQGGAKNTVDLAKDLMDDEDLADLTSARTLQTAAAYATPGVASYDPLLGNYDPSLSAVPTTTPAATALLASLIQPASTRIGAKLMRRMGWREGQGVGPRVTLDQRRKQAKDLGLKLEEEHEDADEAAKHYYAPLDRPLATLEEVGVATDRGWGLGYTPGPSIASSHRQASSSSAAALVSLESDDVYAGSSALPSGDVKSWSVVEVDEEHEEHYVSGSRTGARQQAKRPAASSQSFYDGSRVLAGFSVQRDVVTGPSTSQLPPAPPRGWQPDPKRIYADSTASQDKGKGRQLDAEERGALLGEKLPPPLPKSVFDYMSAKDKERLASISKPPSHDAPSATTTSSQQPDSVVPLVIPPLDGPTALAALKGFQPFSASSTSPDPARQARYTLYLQFQAHLLPSSAATLPFGPRKLPSGATQTIAELNRELDDYARAARVFKPVTGMLAGRFTSGGLGTTLQAAPAAPGLYQPPPKAFTSATDGGGATGQQERPEMLTPAQNAARVGMFGPLTRSAESFRPARLVCKRFGVRVPYEEGEEEEAEAGGGWKEATRSGFDGNRGPTQEVLGKASMEALMQSQGFRRLQPAVEQFDGSGAATADPATGDLKPPGAPDVPSTRARAPDAPTLATVGLGDDEAQGAETLTEQRAPRDIFAAIFADSDDDSDDDDDAEDDSEGSKAAHPVVQPTPTIAPSTTAPPRDFAPPSLPDVVQPEPVVEPSENPLSSMNHSLYRPSFVSTAVRTSKPEGETKKKSKRKAKVALSFDVEDGEEPMMALPVKKKMKRTVEEAPKVEKEVEVEDEWTEAKSTVHPSLLAGKRARASDLYD